MMKLLLSIVKIFLMKLEKLNKNVVIADIDEVKEEALPIYFVTTGGTELAFKEIYEKQKNHMFF